ncbi:MAG: HAMP domain-containing histidine kinase [Chloroflexi bacterium]|nr:HAMP domain-containing histidine kinase [Chloroflexota bacterium]
MRPGWRAISGALATLVGLTGLLLLLTLVLLRPPLSDLVAMAGFLLASGGLTVAAALGLTRWNLPGWIGSLRAKIVLMAVLTAVLALLNVGFTAFLMFLSPHDLALLGGLLAFALGMSVFVAFSVSRTVSDSIHELLDAVRSFNAGNMEAKVPVATGDEVGELAAAFNDMSQRLKESFSKERELERNRREMMQAVSHDLRTPLASIQAMVESINDGVVSDEETVKRYLRSTQTEVENLSQLINDLFELAQLDAGLLELRIEPSSVQDLISDTLESMSAQAHAQSLTLSGKVDEELPPVDIDPQRVQRVLYNLVQNALRHTPPDGTISIQARDAGEEVQVEVKDTGEGIPEGELPHIFQRSYRVDPSRARGSGGAGLGLSIVLGIVEAHGGRIWVESGLGEGSSFTFTLPKSRATAAVGSAGGDG